LDLIVTSSAAGFYVGTFCNECGPHSRESDYFRTQKEALAYLKSWAFAEGWEIEQ